MKWKTVDDIRKAILDDEIEFEDMVYLIYFAFKTANKDTIYTPKKIFEYSPTGELFMIWTWFDGSLNYFEQEYNGNIVFHEIPEEDWGSGYRL